MSLVPRMIMNRWMLLVALLIHSACTPLQPSNDQTENKPVDVKDSAAVMFKMEKNALGAFLAPGAALIVKVFKLTRSDSGEEVLSTQEGNDRKYDLASLQDGFTIDQLQVGRKEIQVSVMSDLEDQVGYGALRLSVTLGMNEVREPLMIKLIADDQRRRDWPVVFNLSFMKPGTENEVIYPEVASIINTRCANSCHNPVANKAELDMSKFPFSSPRFATQEEIVHESIYAMADLTYPMPPAPDTRLPSEDQDKIKAWFDSGLPAVHSSMDQYNQLVEVVKLQWKSVETGTTGEVLLDKHEMTYSANLHAMKIGGHCDLTLIVLGPSGIELKRQTLSNLLLRGVGDYKEDIRIKYEPPVVRVPVVITQP